MRSWPRTLHSDGARGHRRRVRAVRARRQRLHEPEPLRARRVLRSHAEAQQHVRILERLGEALAGREHRVRSLHPYPQQPKVLVVELVRQHDLHEPSLPDPRHPLAWPL